jgi:DNA-directed RNA polymerase specialized sigma24 family protein
VSWAEAAAVGVAIEDEEINEARRQADLQATFERFFLESHPRVEQFLRRVCPDRDLAQDAAQEAFIVTHAKWETVVQHPKPLMWVNKTAWYKLMKLLHQESRYSGVSLDDVPPRLLIEPTTPREAQETVLAMLWSLSLRERAVLALVYDGWSDEEIGWKLDLAIASIRTYKADGRRKMRQLLEEEARLEGRRS